MKRWALLPLCTALLIALAAPAFGQAEVLLSFTGVDYDVPALGSTTYLDVGDGYRQVGFVTSVHPVWLDPYFDTSTNEYTYYLSGLTVATYSFDGFDLYVTFANGTGRADYYEDPSKNAENPPSPPNCPSYGINPPNADVPSKFTDGTLVVGGTVDDGELYYNYPSQSGGMGGSMTIDVDTYGYIPVGSYPGWLVSALASPTPSGSCPVPTGYDHNVSGECSHPVTNTKTKTWGAIKALYR
jgi:hypothetical protein